MNIEMLNLLDRFYALVWPMLRISAFLAFSSIFSIRAVSLRIRLSISIVLAVFLSLHLESHDFATTFGPELDSTYAQEKHAPKIFSLFFKLVLTDAPRSPLSYLQ